MTNLPKVIQELIDSVDFERKECYVYLKNGLCLFLKGNIKAIKAGIRVKDLREETIIAWNSISGFTMLHEVLPREKEDKTEKEFPEIEYESDDDESLEEQEMKYDDTASGNHEEEKE